ncbi:MAG TPA: glycoside hydrolase family 97 N-terminal domain-containing protein, partial [Puia sp.]|nr:glycoside hydrolase family 97 N-terminal domain-containing protein [Puia sp.]
MPQRLPGPSTILAIVPLFIVYTLFIAAMTFVSAPAIAQRTPATAQQSPIRLTSPSGKLQADVFIDPTDHLAWSLKLDGHPIVESSLLGIDAGSADHGQNIRLGAPIFSINNTSYPWKGVHNTARNHYRQARIPITGKVRYTLECRAFDDGFAFRYIVPGTNTLVTGESTSWHIPESSRVWYQENVYYYEGLHYTSNIKDLGVKMLGPPLTYETPAGIYATITEAALYDYSGMSLRSD